MKRFRTVYYNGVTHGDRCNTKTYPTRCKYCQKRVFYFSCDHGSKVFFDNQVATLVKKYADHALDMT